MSMESNPSFLSRSADRKTIEKNRRNQMKALYADLNSLVPRDQSSREPATLPDQLDEAAKYIKKLQVNVERLREKKNRLMGSERSSISSSGSPSLSVEAVKPPQMEVHEMGSALQVVLITGLDYEFLFSKMVRLLHEEGAEIVNASFSVVDDTILHTIHCKVEECVTGYATTGHISERLNKLVHDAYNAS